jgi:hypothetical protein
MTATATYRIWIDWDNDGGLFAGNFEGTLDGWIAVGTNPPQIDLSSAVSHLSGQSMVIPWTAYTPPAADDTGTEVMFGVSGRGFDQGRFGGGSDADVTPPAVQKLWSNLIPGRQYDFTTWVYVPSSGGEPVSLSVDSLATSSASTLTDEWQQLTCTFTATQTQHTLQINASTSTLGTEQTYIDEMMVTGPGEDVTSRVLGLRTPLGIAYGRDQGRSLSTVSPGSTTLEIDNRSRDYSPNNPGSVIAGLLTSGKQVLIKATYDDVTHVLFCGYLSDYTITPDPDNRSVTFTADDALSKLTPNISTPVYEVLRSGDAVHKILDAVGWPTDQRDIDPGATVIQWFCIDAQQAMDALNDVMNSEGPPAIAYVDAANNFVFRDRHHRILLPASISSQATFVDDGPEPQFSAPMTYDIGWSDIVNQVSVSIDQREAGAETQVFSSTDIITLDAGEARTISVAADDPFIDAQVPTLGTDFTLQYGSVNVSLSRTSGKSVDIVVNATAASAVSGMNLRAKPVTAARTYSVIVEDTASISAYGLKTYDGAMPWASINDAYAVGAIIIGQRSERLPIVTLTVNNGQPERLAQILARDISDRCHVIEAETFTDDDFFLERIEHNVADVGKNHTVIFSFEQVRQQVTNVFTFDSDSAGFDQGVFGLSGIDSADTVFVLDVSALDQGLLGT